MGLFSEFTRSGSLSPILAIYCGHVRLRLRVYQAEGYPENDERYAFPHTKNGYLRKITVNPIREERKNNISNLLQHPYCGLLSAQRKIEVETVFGAMKQNKQFVRVHVRGIRKVKTAIGIELFVQNLEKKLIASISLNDLKLSM